MITASPAPALATVADLLRSGRIPEARAAVTQILNAEPTNAQALNLLAAIHRQSGNAAGALAALKRAIRHAPQDAAMRANRAHLLLELGLPEEAIRSIDGAIALRPDHRPDRLLRARVLASTGRLTEALDEYGRILELDADDVDATSGTADCLASLGLHEAALRAYDSVLGQRPGDAVAALHRAVALYELDRLEESLAALDAMAAGTQRPEVDANRALTLLALGRGAEALAAMDRAVTLAQTHPGQNLAALRYHRGLMALHLHDFAGGWPGYEHRWQAGLVDPPRLDRGEPAWNGRTLDGTLRIWREQPIGDEVLFSRFVPECRTAARRLLVECSPRLVPLLARSFPGVEVVAQGQVRERADAQVSLASLPATLPGAGAPPGGGAAYLRADADRVAALRSRYLAIARGRPIIGIAWHSTNRRTGGQKSAPLDAWGALLSRDCLFVNLQYGDAAAEADAAQSRFQCTILSDPEIDQMKDLDAFATQLAAMDRIVSVSNTTVHIAGALGVPTVVMVAPARARLWYWGLHEASTPWYASVQVCRRNRGQHWPDQVALAAAMADRLPVPPP